MVEQRAADWTVSEKERSPIDERLQHGQPPVTKDSRSVQEILAAMDRIRIKPQPGEPTFSEMIIEERKRWRQGM